MRDSSLDTQESRHGGEERHRGTWLFELGKSCLMGDSVSPGKGENCQCFILPWLWFTEKVTVYCTNTLSTFTSLHQPIHLSPISVSEMSSSATDLQPQNTT